MQLSFLTNYAVPVIVGICLCVGFVIKNAITSDKINKFIPLIMAVIGLVLSMWIANWTVTPDVILEGLFSGLASTGLYEAFRNIIELIGKEKNKNE